MKCNSAYKKKKAFLSNIWTTSSLFIFFEMQLAYLGIEIKYLYTLYPEIKFYFLKKIIVLLYGAGVPNCVQCVVR